MRIEWMEDLLAILDSGSLIKAAEKRFVTQPAFSRRIKVIEDSIGVELLNRSRKPAVLHPFVKKQQDRMREIVGNVNELVHELNRQDREALNRVIIASQHAIVTSIAPGLITRLSDSMDINIRLRSANRDECHGLLITKQADIMITYRGPSELPSTEEDFIEELVVGHEQLIPVYATSHLSRLKTSQENGELPIIAYPVDVFLGKVMNTELLPNIQPTAYVRKRTETALTLAALQLSMAGIGIAWVPRSLVNEEIDQGKLTDLSEELPSCHLFIVATRLSGKKSEIKQTVWNTICKDKTM
ncbi:MAG: LysR family transcriptional regulator [Arenicella sp.]